MPAFRQSPQAFTGSYNNQLDVNRKQQEEQQAQQALWQVLSMMNHELTQNLPPSAVTPQTFQPLAQFGQQQRKTQAGSLEETQKREQAINELAYFPGGEKLAETFRNNPNLPISAIARARDLMFKRQDESQSRAYKTADTAETRGYNREVLEEGRGYTEGQGEIKRGRQFEDFRSREIFKETQRESREEPPKNVDKIKGLINDEFIRISNIPDPTQRLEEWNKLDENSIIKPAWDLLSTTDEVAYLEYTEVYLTEMTRAIREKKAQAEAARQERLRKAETGKEARKAAKPFTPRPF